MSKARDKLSLLGAGLAFQTVYYRQLIGACLKGVRAAEPRSFPESLSMARRIHSVRDYTAVLPYRLAALHRLSREIDRRRVPGDVVECGVYNGGSAAVMASVCARSALNRNVWLFDSFEGLPPPTEMDGAGARTCCWWCHGDLSKVEAIFKRLCIPEARVRVVKGWFHETFPTVDIGEIALLHIDADWYESVRLCLETFYDRVPPGGYVVIDDYGHWEGCRRAVDEFLAERAPGVRLTRVDYTGRYFRKP